MANLQCNIVYIEKYGLQKKNEHQSPNPRLVQLESNCVKVIQAGVREGTHRIPGIQEQALIYGQTARHRISNCFPWTIDRPAKQISTYLSILRERKALLQGGRCESKPRQAGSDDMERRSTCILWIGQQRQELASFGEVPRP